MSRTKLLMVLSAVKHSGSYDPDICLVSIEETLTAQEYDIISLFLEWVTKENKSFGWNISDVFNEWSSI